MKICEETKERERERWVVIDTTGVIIRGKKKTTYLPEKDLRMKR